MNLKKISRMCALSIIGLSSILVSEAQDMHFTQFNGAPMIMNPALTGAFAGYYRITGIYRNQWSSVTTPFVTFGTSVDAPLYGNENGYLGGGLALYNDRSGDGNLANMTGLGSLAYHLFMGDSKALSVGLQGGYTQKSIDLARLYWGDEFFNGGFQPGTSKELLRPKVGYFTANLGVGWQHRISEKVAYQLGAAAHNLTQPRESFLQKRNNEVGLGIRFNGQAGLVWDATGALSIRPAVLFQSQTAASELVGGSEFHFVISNPDMIRSMATALFAGAWTRMGDAALFTVGLEHKGFRVGLGYDYNTSKLNVASGGNGGFEISFRYLKSSEFAKRVAFPCARF
jgi:type IX secretion system PorP/SprF family membrane protein